MNYTEVRNDIATALQDLGLNATPYPPGTVETPHGYIASMRGVPTTDFNGGSTASIEVVVLISRSDEPSGWDLIDEYLEPGGALCVTDAINEIDSAGADNLTVQSFETLGGDTSVNDVPYIGLSFTVEVIG